MFCALPDVKRIRKFAIWLDSSFHPLWEWGDDIEHLVSYDKLLECLTETTITNIIEGFSWVYRQYIQFLVLLTDSLISFMKIKDHFKGAVAWSLWFWINIINVMLDDSVEYESSWSFPISKKWRNATRVLTNTLILKWFLMEAFLKSYETTF